MWVIKGQMASRGRVQSQLRGRGKQRVYALRGTQGQGLQDLDSRTPDRWVGIHRCPYSSHLSSGTITVQLGSWAQVKDLTNTMLHILGVELNSWPFT